MSLACIHNLCGPRPDITGFGRAPDVAWDAEGLCHIILRAHDLFRETPGAKFVACVPEKLAGLLDNLLVQQSAKGWLSFETLKRHQLPEDQIHVYCLPKDA